MASMHEIEMALNLVDRGARVSLTAGEFDGTNISIVINLTSGCAVPKRIGYVTLPESAAIALCVQLGEALGL